MARTSVELVTQMRQAVKQIASGAPYQWGHMGSCNCGHLAQAITRRSKCEIHARAMQRHGDWDQQLRDYCPQSGLPMDDLIDEMLELGLTRRDLAHLERLSDPLILKALPPDRRYPKHNRREDVVLYLKTWADLLEQELLAKVSLDDLRVKSRSLRKDQVEAQ
jgi:hypothetical protein